MGWRPTEDNGTTTAPAAATSRSSGCARPPAPPAATADARPRAHGKFLADGGGKLHVRGVTYGTFRPGDDGHEYPQPAAVDRDFRLMAAAGVNAVRTYTVPPRWLLDAAQRHGLRLLVGLPMERYVGYLIDRKGAPDLEAMVREGVRSCAGHPAVLAYAIGNEIPAPIVRWHGRRRMRRFLARLYDAARTEDPDGLVTYVSYPSTEYLDLPFLDLVCFNVYLESQPRLEAYLGRLQNLAGDRPLLMTELGLDSLRHGEDGQARVLDWQVRTAFAAGCAGAFVYAWTDEWHAGGTDMRDWAFGLTRRDRSPKPALASVRSAFAEIPFPPRAARPRASVVVCSYNGGRTIRRCLDGLAELRYPDYEVIVVDDGSTDDTAAIAREYDVRLISTPQRGLSNARNTALEAATGEIVAYLDDDAWPDPHWLDHVADAFVNSDHAAVGGPNIAPDDLGTVGTAVANAPGGPVHVLLSDREAEHIPGCNMAFRRRCLEAIGGFDAQFRIAGDDVDVCWRLQHAGWTLGFSPGAMVNHYPRATVRGYWRQQYNYGAAEALLEVKWPEKYNVAGHLSWGGRVYGTVLTPILRRTSRIYHGVWGSAPFQSIYEPAVGVLGSLPLMPEWYLIGCALLALSALGVLWKPLLLALPLLAVIAGASLVQAGLGAARARLPVKGRSRFGRLSCRVLTALLHLLQPLARLRGRLAYGLTPWRRNGHGKRAGPPWPTNYAFWSPQWWAPQHRLESIESALRARGAGTRRGGHYDRWDLEVPGGLLGSARLMMAVEEHGGGCQLARFRAWPRCSPAGLAVTLFCAALTGGALLDGAWAAAVLLGIVAAALLLRTLRECAAACAALRSVVRDHGAGRPAEDAEPAAPEPASDARPALAVATMEGAR